MNEIIKEALIKATGCTHPVDLEGHQDTVESFLMSLPDEIKSQSVNDLVCLIQDKP